MREISERALRGVSAVAEMLGPSAAEAIKSTAMSSEFGAHVAELSLEIAYADRWNGNDSLTRREKSLMLIATLIALKQPEELKNHLRLGIANGVKVDELQEVLLLLVPYVGLPATSTASKAIRGLLEARGYSDK
jgi:4-carboxymuconolactone decarboxylase